MAPSAGTAGAIPCPASDGRLLTVELAYSDGAAWSEDSVPVTMICAGLPDSPAPPTLLLTSLDILLLEWAPPASDGGSAILGYAVYMKETD